MNTVYLLLGGNIGNVPDTFSKTIELIKNHIGFITEASAVYYTEPWGFESDNLFYNQALAVKTKLAPRALLSAVLSIESMMGRRRQNPGYESRIIDIDILLYNGKVINEKGLEIPHPRMHLRRFALIPLVDIDPGLKHPVFDKTVYKLLEECDDKQGVYLLSNNNINKL